MMLPLAFILAALIGFMDQAYPSFSTRTVRAAGLTANLVRVVAQSSGDARRGRWVLLIVGAVLLFYAAHSLYRAMYMTHLVAWEMTASETHVRSVVLASGLLVLLPIVALLVSLGREAPLVVLLTFGVPTAILVYSALWLWISWLLPHRADRWTDLLPGALAWGAGATVIQLFAVLVVPDRAGNMSSLYGTLAIASSTIAWLFILGRLTVGAATLNAVLLDRRRKTMRGSRTSLA